MSDGSLKKVRKVRFVPRHEWKGYNLSIKIVMNESGCRIFMCPAPKKKFFVEEDLSLMMGLLDQRDFPFTVVPPNKKGKWSGVGVQKLKGPYAEIQFNIRGSLLDFEGSVKFLSSFTTFKVY